MNKHLKNLVLSALFLALGLILPFFTGQIPQIGNMLLPMHFPVLLCGLICGWQYGGVVGLVLPLLRSVCFGAPPLYPNALAMMPELLAYGLVAGLIFCRFRKKNFGTVYISIIPAMIAGRITWGIAQAILLNISDKPFTLAAFWAGGFASAFPGILLQLALIPPLTLLLLKISKTPAKN